jgi:hypothetical protein
VVGRLGRELDEKDCIQPRMSRASSKPGFVRMLVLVVEQWSEGERAGLGEGLEGKEYREVAFGLGGGLVSECICEKGS